MDNKTNWFQEIADRLRDYSEGDVWSDGTEILCRTEKGADAIADMLDMLYRADDNEMQIILGYYDPEEDKRNNEEDRYTGWWFVNVD